jgi:hypothetical protein
MVGSLLSSSATVGHPLELGRAEPMPLPQSTICSFLCIYLRSRCIQDKCPQLARLPGQFALGEKRSFMFLIARLSTDLSLVSAVFYIGILVLLYLTKVVLKNYENLFADVQSLLPVPLLAFQDQIFESQAA